LELPHFLQLATNHPLNNDYTFSFWSWWPDVVMYERPISNRRDTLMRPSAKLHQRGLSVLELVLIVTLLLSLAAFVVPDSANSVGQREASLAGSDCRNIVSALERYEKDTGFLPTGFRGSRSYGWLRGFGADPEFKRVPAQAPGELTWFLSEDKMGAAPNWGGPYLNPIPMDPWGRRYVVLLQGMDASSKDLTRVWVLSSGPNGIVETNPEDSVIAGDDVGISVD
jgi:general secretion pathway protein G